MNPNESPCPVCGTPAPPDSEFGVVLHHCPACDLRFRGDLGPEWSEDYDRAESDGYVGRNELELLGREQQRWLEATRRAEWVAEYVPAGELLEIGCAAGEFLDTARQRGLRVRGLEASPRLSEIARSRYGLTVEQGLAEQRLEATASYDAVCMWHVLEHVRFPTGVLAAAAAVLKPDGMLFIEVPNIASAGARALGVEWPSLAFADHAVHFSPAALAAALHRGGLTAVELTTLLPWEYLSARERLRPRRIAGRLHRGLIAGTVRARHPSSGDFLRATARPDRSGN